METIILINIIGIVLVAVLWTVATILLVYKPKPKKKPINCCVTYKDIIVTKDETIFIEEDGTEVHFKN